MYGVFGAPAGLRQRGLSFRQIWRGDRWFAEGTINGNLDAPPAHVVADCDTAPLLRIPAALCSQLDTPNPLLKRWLCLCISKLVEGMAVLRGGLSCIALRAFGGWDLRGSGGTRAPF